MDKYKETLRDLYDELQSTAAVGEVLGISAEKVRKDAIKLGIPLRKRGGRVKFEVSLDQLKADYQTLTMAQIAAKYGVGETTVWSRIKEYGIEHEQYGDLGHRHRPREFTEQHRQRMSEARKGKYMGENGGNWKGGVTLPHLRERQSRDYRIWRTAALTLRGSKCQECGKADGNVCECCGTQVKLHVHHLFSFAAYPERRFDPQNSEVLCPKCHYSRHKRKTG